MTEPTREEIDAMIGPVVLNNQRRGNSRFKLAPSIRHAIRSGREAFHIYGTRCDKPASLLQIYYSRAC